jgi:hypothetical protein
LKIRVWVVEWELVVVGAGKTRPYYRL